MIKSEMRSLGVEPVGVVPEILLEPPNRPEQVSTVM